MNRPFPISLPLLLAGAVPLAADDAGIEFFKNEVRPIFEENCFKCHGGTDSRGEVKVRGELQLISRKGMMIGGDHGPAINLEKPEESVILMALSYENDDLEMPPRGKLDDSKIETVRKWIEMGAPWTPEDADLLVEVHDPLAGVTEVNETTRNHWSYRAMERPEVPKAADSKWNENPVDAFIASKIEAEGLTPNDGAGRAELLRRASYDLTGLPPTLEEIRQFVEDKSPDAWEKQVERLLASPHYGEKWARHWLDVVRYAESNGFERDAEKTYVWRYRDWVIDAFNEDKPYDRFVAEQIAGDELPDRDADSMIATGFHRLMQWDDEPADPKQYEFDVLDDNVRVISEGFMAMTLGCARCHDHKGDPMPQTDYYRFTAFVRGIKPMQKGNANLVMVDLPEGESRHESEQEKLQDELEELRKQVERIEGEAVELARKKHPELAVRLIGGGGNRHLVTDARTNPWTWHYTTQQPAEDWSAVSFRAEQEGWERGLAGFGTTVPGAAAKTLWNVGTIWLQTTFGLEEVPEQVVMHLYHDEDIEVFLNGRPVLARTGHVKDYLTLEMDEEFLGALQTGRNVLAVKVSQTGGGQYFDLGLEAGGLLPADLVTKVNLPKEKVRRYRQLTAKLKSATEKLRNPRMEVLAVQEVGRKAPPTHLLIRGSAHAPEDEVVPGFPAIWGGEDAKVEPLPDELNSSGRRLALANWLTRPDNPRTARVMVNRIWQHHFGRGICPTPNDFGYLGTEPTHPELLDWLATEFVERGWSVKKMHRLIMTSRAYRMSSESRYKEAEKDPSNDLFWRFNPRRLTAEEIRDSILLATGELNLEAGGPSVYVDLPAEVLATSSTKAGKWGKSPEDQANRRSIYVKLKRSLMPPMFADFDLSDIDNSCPVRFTTTVPTQALAMLHSDFTNKKATVLADRIQKEGGADLKAQVERAFELMVSRPASADEIDRSLKFIETMKTEHQLDEETAVDRFCLALLNLNEFLYLD
ncbi:hypothetical protein HAHE_08320 [Haloferula helveola]|uniref:Cytochrome c domain-containing protein n=1 Tax=Haloferula helveola TaxID=490095 RepID=A0ABM7RDP3_9BACT|nr:hypothetical protein HAHE_08320 [Haloferula helveola]